MADWLAERLTFRNVFVCLAAMLALGFTANGMHRTAKLKRSGALAYPEPVQTDLDEPFEIGGPENYTIMAVAEYDIQALVLGAEGYSSDRAADLSPIDLALAWGVAATPECYEKVSFSQSGRWYHFSWGAGATTLTPVEIGNASANTHIIPAFGDSHLEGQLTSIGRGDAVHLRGYLVRVKGSDGYMWNSSLKRTDVGDGSCEIFYVTEFEEL